MACLQTDIDSDTGLCGCKGGVDHSQDALIGQCQTCHYWTCGGHKDGHHFRGDNQMGSCHRTAPIHIDTNTDYVIWPITNIKDWCGEFKLRRGLMADPSTPRKG